MPETFKRTYGGDLADAEQIDQMQKLRVFDGAAFHGSTVKLDRIMLLSFCPYGSARLRAFF